MPKRSGAGARSRPEPGDGVRALKRISDGRQNTGEPAARLLLESWSKRHSAPRFLFSASHCGLEDIVGQLMPLFLLAPCPSPIVVEYLKETLVVSFAAKAALVDKAIVDLCASERCAPSFPFRFQAVVDICRAFLWNAWCKRDPGDSPDSDAVPASTPTAAVLRCLRLFLRGIQHWHALAKSGAAAGEDATMDPMVEHNMELCAAALRRILGCDLFADRLQEIVARAPEEWSAFTSAFSATCNETAGDAKLKGLWDDARTLSDPLQLLIAAEPALIRDMLGADLQSDDVTRRTLMLAMWSMMDRSDHGGVDIDSLALLMHDVRALQGSLSGHFIYNMWLSALFILHSNKVDTPERIVARHFLLASLPLVFKAMCRLEPRSKLWSASPLVGLVVSEDSMSATGALEQAFAKVRAWPQFLYINTPAPASGTSAAAPVAPDVWPLVCHAFVEAGAMTEEQVVANIKPLATWKITPPEPLGPDDLRQGKRPVTKQDVLTIETLLTDQVPSWNQLPPLGPHPEATLTLWQLLCDEVVAGSRCSVEAAKTVARMLGVPPNLPPEPEPAQPLEMPATATTVQLQAAAKIQHEHAHAAAVAAAVVPKLTVQPHVYLELARVAVKKVAVIDIVLSCNLLDTVVLGLVFMLDILGSYTPPPTNAEDEVHDTYGELFLIICQLVNRYKLHQSEVFMVKLEEKSRTWAKWAQRGCFCLWLRRHKEMLRQGKLQMDDRSVENKLVEAIFNQNWGKKEPLQRAVQAYSPWAVIECVPSFAERVFQGCAAERMDAKSAAQALQMLCSVVRYAMVDCIAYLSVQVTTLRMEAGGKIELISAQKAIEVLLLMLETLSAPQETAGAAGVAREPSIVVIDRNMAWVLNQFPTTEANTALVQKLKSSLDLSPIDFQSCKRVIYDVLVGVHFNGPQLKFSQDMRFLRSRCGAHDVAMGVINEVMILAAQGNSSPSFATMFNLSSIGTFLLSHSARSSGENSSKDSNVVAECFLLRVLPAVLTRLDNQRQALLLARFTTMLAIFNGCAAWRGQRDKPKQGLSSKPPGQHALEVGFGSVAQILERLAAPCCWPIEPGSASESQNPASANAGGMFGGGGGLPHDLKDPRDVAVFMYALSLLCHALRVRWLARYVQLERAARALRRLGYFSLASLCLDCQKALQRRDLEEQLDQEPWPTLFGAIDNATSVAIPPGSVLAPAPT